MDYQDFDENDNSSIPPHAYYPNRASLDAAVARSIQDGIVPRILLLSHPQNPLGICYPPHVVTEIIDWCRDHKIHLISDEIYAGSIYRPEDAEFVSALELASTTTTTTKSSSSSDDDDEQQQQQKNQYLGLGPYVHLVYALSKDFALSGLRVGALYSENAEIRVPLQKLNDLSCISSHTQILVERMLTATTTDDDDDLKVSWTKRFLSQNHQRLQARGDAWHSCLDDLQIPYLKATAGLFVWMDFSEFLPNDGSSDEERERALYLDLLHGHGLLFTPGHSMKNERPGFFRCVFTAASEQEFALGMERLRKYVHAKRG
jgi:aspartate/methionine/tyrosine aminotransferase